LQVWEFNCGREHGERLERTHIPADTGSVWFWDLKRLFGMKLDFKFLRGQVMNAIAILVLLTQFFFPCPETQKLCISWGFKNICYSSH
jgi:preprotein translocase subunit Sec61beta